MAKEAWKRSQQNPMEIELELVPKSKSKIQVLEIERKSKIQTQANLDEICPVEEEETVDLDISVDFDADVGVLPAFLHDDQRRYAKQDLKYNFSVIYFMSWINMSPYGVDKSSGNYPRVRVFHEKWWENLICFGWYLLASLRLVTLNFSMAHFLLAQDREKELGRMTLMLCLSVAFTFLMFIIFSFMTDTIWHAVPFDSSVFKYLEQGKNVFLFLQTPPPGNHDGTWWGKFKFGGHTPKELLIINLPFLVYSMCGMIPLMSIFDPSFPLLLVSLLPPESGFSLGFFSVDVLDSIIFTYYIMIIHFIFFVFFGMHRIQEEAQLAIKNLTMQSKSLEAEENSELDWEKSKILKALKSLRLVHIWTQFYNLICTAMVYRIKLTGHSMSILGGFGLIKMIKVESWTYAGILGLLFFEGIILYNICFGEAYNIPEKIEELKREIRKLSYKIQRKKQGSGLTPDERKYIEKVLRSIPWLGVKDGVYKMERMTCVNFLEFVVKQITSLVLAY